jgi:hypothetical protein
VPNIISDPTGILTEIHAVVEKDFTKRKWVHKRCENVLREAESGLEGFLDSEQDDLNYLNRLFVLLWRMAYACDLPILADLQIPTGIRLFALARRVLEKYGKLCLHEKLLEQLGSARLAKRQVSDLLAGMTAAFDRAVEVIRTPFFFDFDICEPARPVFVDGPKELIDSGYFREAVFFIVVIFNRSLKAILNDAPEDEKEKFTKSYQKAMSTLGFTSEQAIIKRTKRLKALLPEIMEVAEYIIENNPHIIK